MGERHKGRNQEGPEVNQLVQIRHELNWTQHQAAEYLGISLRAYQDSEAANSPRRAYVLALSTAAEKPVKQSEITTSLLRWISNLGGIQNSLAFILAAPNTATPRRFRHIAEELEYLAKNIRERTGVNDERHS